MEIYKTSNSLQWDDYTPCFSYARIAVAAVKHSFFSGLAGWCANQNISINFSYWIVYYAKKGQLYKPPNSKFRTSIMLLFQILDLRSS